MILRNGEVAVSLSSTSPMRYSNPREKTEWFLTRIESCLSAPCAVEDLEGWYPRLFLEPHSIACVDVMNRYSGPPAVFEVTCAGITSRWLGQDNAFRLKVSWAAQTAAKASRFLATIQQKPMVELASVALAFLLARRLLALGQLDLNDYGERADYRSLSAGCVLEVSGTEDTSELGRRHREKVAQALDNTYGWGACVVVCAFSAKGHRIRVSRHGPAES